MKDFVSGINGTSIYADRAYADVSGNAFETTYARNSSLSSYALSSDVSGVIDTVSSNSATWGGGGDAFPAEIVTAGTVRAVVTTGFQDNTATRPTLFISSNPSTTAYPRMMLSENHATTGKSGAFLADAFEFYNGTGVKVFRADPTGVSALKFFLGSANVYGTDWSLTTGSVSGGNTTSNWFLNRNWVSGISGTATWQYGTAEYNQLTSVHDTVSANSASWAESGVDSATVSSIASSYAESAASSKMDTSAMTSYALSADVSGTVDLVSTQSANWGGSALALLAGPGVKLELSGSTLVASTDETVLYSATAYAPGDTQQSYSLIETPMNFETVRVFAYRPLGNGAPWFGSVDIQIGNLYNYTAANTSIVMPCAFFGTSNNIFYEGQYAITNITSTSWEDGLSTQRKTTETAYTTGYYAHIYKIIGINRTAGV